LGARCDCYQFLGDATWVYILALVLSLIFMLVTKTVHPPAGANPLLMLHARMQDSRQCCSPWDWGS
jgi:CBS-domain-containing membrane protein